MDRLGVIGVGHFGAAMVRGLIRSGWNPDAILLSPRGGEVASLAAEFGVTVAADNADVVARAAVVFLSVRPTQAIDVVGSLPWRKGQLMISVCAGVPIVALSAATGAIPTIVRAMPMTSAAIGVSPTVVFPDHPPATVVLERFGSVVPLEDEAQFEIATAVAVAYTFCHDLVSRTADWAAAAGLEWMAARLLSAAHFESAAKAMALAKDVDREVMMRALVTEGGVAEAAYGPLRAGHVGETWEAALDAALARIRRARS